MNVDAHEIHPGRSTEFRIQRFGSLSVCLSIIAATGIIALALATYSESGDVLRHGVSTPLRAKI